MALFFTLGTRLITAPRSGFSGVHISHGAPQWAAKGIHENLDKTIGIFVIEKADLGLTI